MKKIFAILLALVLVLSMSAMAASITIEQTTKTGSINNETYTAYLVFSAVIDGDNVSYTIDSSSKYFEAIKNSDCFELTQLNTSSTYVVTKNDNYTDTAAKTLANTLARVSGATAAGTSTYLEESDSYKIADLAAGYYLVTSSIGDALILDTLKDETIITKNSYPDLVKTSNATDGTADLGSEIQYTITVDIPETAVGEIVVHDTMTGADYAGMVTDVNDKITVVTKDELTDGCTMHFTLLDDYVANNLGKTVSFTYKATISDNTVTNEAKLTDNKYTSTPETVTVKNYNLDVFKYTMNGENETGLAGAGFVLKKGETYYKEIEVDGKVTKIEWVSDINKATEITTTFENDYKAVFTGLANGDYVVVEKTVPAGYNPASDTKVTIKDKDNTGTVKVLNSTGSELPSTGGIGATIFYVVGGLMVAAAIVLLVAKKKASSK